jgi:hypothetical protein
VAVCGSVWQYMAVCGSVWQYVAVRGSMWQCVAVCGSVWQFGMHHTYMNVCFTGQNQEKCTQFGPSQRQGSYAQEFSSLARNVGFPALLTNERKQVSN